MNDSDDVAKIFLGVLAQERVKNPVVGAQAASRKIVQRLLDDLKDERGVHVESLLAALGSLAGYACQMSVRALLIDGHGMPEEKAFVIVETQDGSRYFFGDPLNKLLAEDAHSVWSLAAGQAQHLGCAILPDVAEIFSHVSASVGGPDFGVPRVPENHRPRFMPIDYVKVVWPALLPVVKNFCPAPALWPVLYGLAVQQVMELGKGAIDPCSALRIVMECAVPMSKFDMPSKKKAIATSRRPARTQPS
jgi:hypothetical protein